MAQVDRAVRTAGPSSSGVACRLGPGRGLYGLDGGYALGGVASGPDGGQARCSGVLGAGGGVRCVGHTQYNTAGGGSDIPSQGVPHPSVAAVAGRNALAIAAGNFFAISPSPARP